MGGHQQLFALLDRGKRVWVSIDLSSSVAHPDGLPAGTTVDGEVDDDGGKEGQQPRLAGKRSRTSTFIPGGLASRRILLIGRLLAPRLSQKGASVHQSVPVSLAEEDVSLKSPEEASTQARATLLGAFSPPNGLDNLQMSRQFQNERSYPYPTGMIRARSGSTSQGTISRTRRFARAEVLSFAARALARARPAG